MLGPDRMEGQDIYTFAGDGSGTMFERITGNPPGSVNFGRAILIQPNGLIRLQR